MIDKNESIEYLDWYFYDDGGADKYAVQEYISPKCTVNFDLQVDTEKVDQDLDTLKQMLMSLAGRLHRKLVFVVDENGVEVFQNI